MYVREAKLKRQKVGACTVHHGINQKTLLNGLKYIRLIRREMVALGREPGEQVGGASVSEAD